MKNPPSNMKNTIAKRNIRRILAGSISAACTFAVFLAAPSAHAAAIVWDITPGTVGVGDSLITGGAGTWNTANGNWTTDAGVNNIAWDNANNDTAVFGGTAGAVNLLSNVTVGGLTFNTTGYSITNSAANTITFGVDGAIFTDTSVTAIIGQKVLSGSATVEKTGAGILTLGNNLTTDTTTNFTGALKISEGTVRLAPYFNLTKSVGSFILNGGALHGWAGSTINQTTTNVSVTADSTVSAGESGSASGQDRSLSLGALSIGANTLTLTKHSGSSATTVSFTSTTLSGNAVFDVLAGSFSPNTKGNLGNLSDGGAGRTITKNGPGDLTWGTITLSGNHVWNVNQGTLTSGAIGGSFGITKGGAGTLVLNTTGTYSGSTTIGAGILQANSSGALGDGSATNTLIFTGGTLQAAATITSPAARGVTLTSTGIIDTNSQAVSIAGNMTGAGGLTKNGAGTLTLSGTNNYDGLTTVNLGTLLAKKAAALPGYDTAARVSVVSGATLAVNVDAGGWSSGEIDSLLGATTAAFASGSTLGVEVTTGSFDYANNIGATQTAKGLVKSGAGTLVLSGTNTHTGVTTISAGTLSVATIGDGGVASGNLGSATSAAGNIVFNGNSTLQYTGANATSNRAFTINAGVTATIDTANNISFAGATGTATTGALTKTGAGTLTLTSANTNTGLTTVSAGTLAYGINNMISTGGVTVNGATAVLDLGLDRTDSVGTVIVDGGGSITGTGTSALTSTATFDMRNGSVSARLAGSIGLTKSTAGTVTLSGANTYGGLTTVSGGTLTLSGSGTLGSGAGGLTMSGGSLNLGGLSRSVAAVSVTSAAASGDTISNGSLTGTSYAASNTTGNVIISANLLVNASAGFAKSGAGTVTLSGANTYTGGTSLTGGMLQFANTAAMPATGAVAVGTGTTLVVNAGAASGEWTNATSGNGSIGGLLAGLGGQVGGTVSYTGNVALGIDTTNAVGSTMTYSGVIGNVGTTLGITKLGTGTLVLDQPNTYTGVTTISGGILSVGTIGDGGVASGNLGSATSAAGNIVFNGGTLQYTGANATSNRAFTINAGVTATIDTANNISFAGATGTATTGALTKTGAGILTLSAANTYTGLTTVSNGELQWGITNALSSGNLTINSGGTANIVNYTDTVGTVTLAQGGAIIGTSGILDTGVGGFVSNGGGTISGFTTGALGLGGILNNAVELTYNDVGVSTTLSIDRLYFRSSGTGATPGRTFNIADGDAAVDFEITSYLGNPSSGSNTNFTKNGAGVMQLSGSVANTNWGANPTVIINEGTLLLNKSGSATALPGSGLLTIGDNGGAAGSESVIVRYTTGSSSNQIESNPITINRDGLFDLNGFNETISGALTHSSGGSLTTGAGILTLGAVTNTISGTSTVTGNLTFSGTAATNLTIGGTADINGTTTFSGGAGGGITSTGTPEIQGTLALGTANRSIVVSSGTLDVSAQITGSTGTTTKSGAGTLTLSNASNTYSGTIAVSGGTLTISGSGTLGSAGLTMSGGTFDLAGLSTSVGAVSVTSAAGSGDTILNGSLTGTSYAASNTTGNAIISANLLVNGGAGFAKSGAGTLTLSGANTYTGLTNVSGGTLALSGSGTLGNGAGLTMSGGTLNLAGLSTSVGAVSVTSAAGSGDTILNGSLTGTSYAASNTTGNAIISANLLVNGGAGFAKSGAGTLTLSGANTYTGNTTLTSGTLNLGVAENVDVSGPLGKQLANAAGTIVLNGGTLQYSAANTHDYSGRFSTAGSQAYNANTNEQTVIWATNLTSSGGTLTKSGAGSLELTGANTYSGTTTVSAGTLILSGRNSSAGATTASGGILQLNSTRNGGLASGTFTVGGATVQALNADRTISQGISLSGNPTFSGNYSISSLGQMNGSNGARIVTNNIASGKTLTIGSYDRGGSNYQLTIDGSGTTIVNGSVTTGSIGGGLVKSGTGTLILSGSGSFIPAGFTISGGTVIFRQTQGVKGDTGSNSIAVGAALNYVAATDTTLSLEGADSAALTINGGSGGTFATIGGSIGNSATSSRIIAGGNILVPTPDVKVNVYGVAGVTRPGTPDVTTTNYTLLTGGSGGATTLNNGNYSLGTVFNNTDFTVGAITKSTTGLFIDVTKATALSGNVNWKGGLSGNTGVWSASTGVSGGQSNWQVTDLVNQPLAPGATADLVFSTAGAPITDPGTMAAMTLGADVSVRTLTINNTATAFDLDADGFKLTITPASSSAGITIASNVQASTIAANVALGAAQTWTNDSINALTVSGVVSGGGANGLTIAGTGTTILTGINTYTGTTTVSAGTLLVSGSLSGSSAVSVTAGTLGGTGTVGPVTVSNGAFLQGGDGVAASGSLTSANNVNLNDGATIKLTLGAASAHSSLTRTGGTWVFDADQAFLFNAGAVEGTYDNIITGLTGSEAGLATIGTWTLNVEYVGSTFSYDGSGGVDLVLVPEPGAAVSLLGGLGILLGLRRRRSA